MEQVAGHRRYLPVQSFRDRRLMFLLWHLGAARSFLRFDRMNELFEGLALEGRVGKAQRSQGIGVHSIGQPGGIGGTFGPKRQARRSRGLAKSLSALDRVVKGGGELEGPGVSHHPMGADETAATTFLDPTLGPAAQPCQRPALLTDPARIEEDEGAVPPQLGAHSALEIFGQEGAAICQENRRLVGPCAVEVAVSDEMKEADPSTFQELDDRIPRRGFRADIASFRMRSGEISDPSTFGCRAGQVGRDHDAGKPGNCDFSWRRGFSGQPAGDLKLGAKEIVVDELRLAVVIGLDHLPGDPGLVGNDVHDMDALAEPSIGLLHLRREKRLVELTAKVGKLSHDLVLQENLSTHATAGPQVLHPAQKVNAEILWAAKKGRPLDRPVGETGLS